MYKLNAKYVENRACADIEKNAKKRGLRSAKECAYIAVFVALVIAAQVALSAIPGVEIVTVLFAAYAYALGGKRGAVAATAFSLLRQMVFGFFPTVLLLYVIYYNALVWAFALAGKTDAGKGVNLLKTVCLAVVCTLCFTLLDNVITPLWYGYTQQAARAYFLASLPFLIPQTLSAGVSAALLFLPLHAVFSTVKRTLVHR